MLLTVLLVAAAVVRLYRLDAHGLWLDERISVNTACGGVLGEPIGTGMDFTPNDFWNEDTLPRTLRAVVVGNQGNGLLYHLLLRSWMHVAGTSDFVVRLPSVAMGVLTVWWTFGLARHVAAASVAWWTGAIAAVHPFLVRYSQEARPYAMAVALTTLSTLLFVRLVSSAGPHERGRHRNLIGYLLATTAGCLTHYLTIVVFAVHLGVAVFTQGARPARRRIVFALGVAGVLASLWMPLGGAEGLRGMARLTRQYGEKARSGDPDRFLKPLDVRMVGGGIYQMAAPLVGGAVEGWKLPAWRALPLFLPPVVLAFFGWRHRRRLELLAGAWALLVALTIASVIFSTVIAVRAGHGVSFLPRYAVFAAPFAAIVLAFGLSSRERLVRFAAVGEATVMAVALWAVYSDVPHYREPNPYAALAARIRAAPQLEVVHLNWSEARMVNVYLARAPLPRERIWTGHP